MTHGRELLSSAHNLQLVSAGPAKNEEEAAKKSYQFWSTQPVPSIDEVVTSNEWISPDVAVAEVTL